MFICSFTVGCYRVRSKSGKQSQDFEDSDRFGPARVNMRTGDLSEIPAKSWFWDFYDDWRAAGRPTEGKARSTPHGPLEQAVWPDGEGRVPSSTTEADKAPGIASNPIPTSEGGGA